MATDDEIMAQFQAMNTALVALRETTDATLASQSRVAEAAERNAVAQERIAGAMERISNKIGNTR